ncbi:MAG: hypothetical protein VCF07_19960, partial [Nitrospinota bacterium]
MRCPNRKCGFVTFDIHDGCPKCGKSVPHPIVRTITPRTRRKKSGGSSYLSSLAFGHIPRFYGNENDPEVISLLGDVALEVVSGSLEAEVAVKDVPLTGAAAPITNGGDDGDSWDEDDSGLESEAAAEVDAAVAEDPALEDFDSILEEASAEPEAPAEAGAEEEDPFAGLDTGELDAGELDAGELESGAAQEPALEDFDSILEEASAGPEAPAEAG